MLLALLLLATAADWVPVRWPGSDPKSLELIKGTAVNCLLLEQKHWSPEFSTLAAAMGVTTLGVLRPGDPLERLAERLTQAKLQGAVLEGDFADAAVAPVRASLDDSRLALVELTARVKMRLDGGAPITGTFQGVWPGINLAEDGSAKAAPSGAPWIDTNSGFLRFARSLTSAGIWIAYYPPAKGVTTLARYQQAVGDAAMAGARWVVSFDADLAGRLMAGDAKARVDWSRLTATIGFFEQHRDWTRMDSLGKLAVVQDIDSGGLISGGVLDMIAVKHTPARLVPGRRLSPASIEGATMAVNVDPAALDEEKKETLKKFTRGGGTLLTAPPGRKLPKQRADQITLDKDDVAILDEIWKEVNSMTDRHNLGVRLFNVASMLSSLVGPAGGRPAVLFLVNYSDYPVENVTAHLLGNDAKATLYEPAGAPKSIPVYKSEDGTGVDVAKVGQVAALVLE